MHPSPIALMSMTDDELMTYRNELRESMLDRPENDNPFGGYRARIDLIDCIIRDRKVADDLHL